MNTASLRALLLALLYLLPGASQAERFALADLGRLLADTRQSEADFVEIKTLAMLDRPLKLQGRLYFRAPDYLRKYVISPHHEDYEIDGQQVRVQDERGSRTISLDRHPALRALAEAFRATLGGDFAALQRYYQLHLRGSRDDWQLTMTPREPGIAARVERIEVAGSGAALFSVLILERDGDQSLMRMRSVGD